MNTSITPATEMRQILGAIRTTLPESGVQVEVPGAVEPFVTIARQAGSGSLSLADALAERLNETDGGGRPWQVFDRNLVEKVAADHNIAHQLIESLEDTGHTWLEEMFKSLVLSDSDVISEAKIYRRIAETIRALAQVGRVIMVGRGGAFVTHNMERGVHVRLIAPLTYRVAKYAERFNLSAYDAERRVRNLDHNRESFYRRYWSDRIAFDEAFTLTLNTAEVDDRTAVESILPLIRLG